MFLRLDAKLANSQGSREHRLIHQLSFNPFTNALRVESGLTMSMITSFPRLKARRISLQCDVMYLNT
jgi:hypothetical protein